MTFSTTKQIVAGLCLAVGLQTGYAQKLTYPATKQVDQTDNYHGTEVKDPYRWLEDDNSAETKDWVTRQNEFTQSYLSKIPYRAKTRERIEKLTNYARMSAPSKYGEYYFFSKNDGLQNQSVIYVQKGLTAQAEVLLDPNKLSADGTVSISNFAVSPDGKHVAYSISKGGSDWQEFYVLETATKTQLKDHLQWIKFSGASWFQNGFFYSRYPEPPKGQEFTQQNENMKVYYHKLGTDQSADVLIYEDPANPKRNFGLSVSDDEKYFFLDISEGASGENMLYFAPARFAKPEFKPIVSELKGKHHIIDHIDGKFYAVTNTDAPRDKVVVIDPANPEPKNWKTLVPESKDVLKGAAVLNNQLVLIYLQDVADHAYLYDLSGKKLKEVAFPTLGAVSGFGGKRADTETFYSFTSFTYPATVYRYDLKTGQSTVFFQPKVEFNPADYETKQVFYPSKDGTKVPMFIVHKKGLKLDGANPTLLYAYGGFNINLLPTFSATRLYLLENGGVFAMPNLRGGGEYGEAWHDSGKLDKKQNVFNDFIAAAEYLIQNKYTSSQRLAIQGGSNGGLLVGACMTQRPELFKVAFPAVGVLDMLRFHKFTIGWAWVPEYGSSDDAAQFKTLYAYSPLHRLKKGAAYPATLVTTADHDDRVVPAHSFKFAAALQDAQGGPAPTLISIQVKAGHGAGKPISKVIDEAADMYAFMFYNMGFTPSK